MSSTAIIFPMDNDVEEITYWEEIFDTNDNSGIVIGMIYIRCAMRTMFTKVIRLNTNVEVFIEEVAIILFWS